MPVVIHESGEIQVNGRWLNVDSEVTINGERGRFRYTGFSHSSEGKLILHFVGGSNGHDMMRSFYPDRVKTVHNKKRGRR